MGSRTASLLATFGLLLLSSRPVSAIGAAAFGNEIVSARSIGQGQVGIVGQSDDPAVVYLNPAGMMALPGTQATVGLSFLDLNGKYRSENNVESKMVDKRGVVPNIAVTHRFKDERWAVGLSLQSPYGFKTNWTEFGPLRYTATNARLYLFDISPAVAYKVNSMLSIGLAGDFVNAYDVIQARRIANPDASDGNAALEGQGKSMGMHGGVVITPTERHAFGITYHSEMKLTVKGSVKLDGLGPTLASVMGGTHYETAIYTDLFIPQNIQLGYAFRPTPRWDLEVNTAWYDWDSNHDLNVRYADSDPIRASILNTGNPTPLNRRSAWSLAAGVNHRYSDRWQFRGGVGYLPHATPESVFIPSVIDLTRFGVNVGFGWKLSSHLTLDTAYSAVMAQSRHITTSATGINSISGTYSNFIHLIALNLTLRVP